VFANPILAETESGHSCPHERRRDAKTYAATVLAGTILAGGTGDADKSVRAP